MQVESEAGTGCPYRAEVGYEFPCRDVVVSAEEQRRLHRWCGIPSERYGDFADVTFVGRLPILLNTTTVRTARPGWAPVHTVQRMRQTRPVRLDESLQMTGRVTALEPHPRGTLMRSEWHYRDAGGAVVLVVEPDVLMGDPDAARTPAGRAPQALAQHWESLARFQCTPASTLGYCEGSENLIHLDPEYARSFGFRAPIIAGMQTINFLLSPLYSAGVPRALDVEIRFERPVFWDDRVAVEGRRGALDEFVELRAVNGAGKSVAACTLNDVYRAPAREQ